MNKTLFLLFSVLLSFPLFAGQFYVYKDMQGQTHIEDYVTDDAARYGYKIVSGNGVTIGKVTSIAAQEKAIREAKQTGKSQLSWNAKKARKQALLYRFTGLSDIRDIGNKKILGLQAQIDMTNDYIKSFERNLAALEKQAGFYTKKLKSVPKNEIEAIARVKENIRENRLYIEQRRIEQHKVRDEFLILIDEYKELVSVEE